MSGLVRLMIMKTGTSDSYAANIFGLNADATATTEFIPIELGHGYGANVYREIYPENRVRGCDLNIYGGTQKYLRSMIYIK